MNINDDIKYILLSEEELENKCKELGARLSKDYEGKEPIFLVLLKGAVNFSTVLGKYITIPMEFDYMKPSSYDGTKSTGKVTFKVLPSLDLNNRHVVIVEDIIDSGLTLSEVDKLLRQTYKLKSLEVITLLDKKERRKVVYNPKYNCFDIPDEFVVGYGLDYNEKYRNLPYIGVLKEEVYNK